MALANLDESVAMEFLLAYGISSLIFETLPD